MTESIDRDALQAGADLIAHLDDDEPDALYPGGHNPTPPLTVPERVLAVALAAPWLAAATGWAAVVTAASVVRWALR